MPWLESLLSLDQSLIEPAAIIRTFNMITNHLPKTALIINQTYKKKGNLAPFWAWNTETTP